MSGIPQSPSQKLTTLITQQQHLVLTYYTSANSITKTISLCYRLLSCHRVAQQKEVVMNAGKIMDEMVTGKVPLKDPLKLCRSPASYYFPVWYSYVISCQRLELHNNEKHGKTANDSFLVEFHSIRKISSQTHSDGFSRC